MEAISAGESRGTERRSKRQQPSSHSGSREKGVRWASTNAVTDSERVWQQADDARVSPRSSSGHSPRPHEDTTPLQPLNRLSSHDSSTDNDVLHRSVSNDSFNSQASSTNSMDLDDHSGMSSVSSFDSVLQSDAVQRAVAAAQPGSFQVSELSAYLESLKKTAQQRAKKRAMRERLRANRDKAAKEANAMSMGRPRAGSLDEKRQQDLDEDHFAMSPTITPTQSPNTPTFTPQTPGTDPDDETVDGTTRRSRASTRRTKSAGRSSGRSSGQGRAYVSPYSIKELRRHSPSSPKEPESPRKGSSRRGNPSSSSADLQKERISENVKGPSSSQSNLVSSRSYADPRLARQRLLNRGRQAAHKGSLKSDWLYVGNTVLVSRGRYNGETCTVAYVGAVDFARGTWVGVYFTKPIGQHDGTVQGRSYFKCPPLQGAFLKRIVLAPASTGSDSPRAAPRSMRGSVSVGDMLTLSKLGVSLEKLKPIKRSASTRSPRESPRDRSAGSSPRGLYSVRGPESPGVSPGSKQRREKLKSASTSKLDSPRRSKAERTDMEDAPDTPEISLGSVSVSAGAKTSVATSETETSVSGSYASQMKEQVQALRSVSASNLTKANEKGGRPTSKASGIPVRRHSLSFASSTWDGSKAGTVLPSQSLSDTTSAEAPGNTLSAEQIHKRAQARMERATGLSYTTEPAPTVEKPPMPRSVSDDPAPTGPRNLSGLLAFANMVGAAPDADPPRQQSKSSKGFDPVQMLAKGRKKARELERASAAQREQKTTVTTVVDPPAKKAKSPSQKSPARRRRSPGSKKVTSAKSKSPKGTTTKKAKKSKSPVDSRRRKRSKEKSAKATSKKSSKPSPRRATKAKAKTQGTEKQRTLTSPVADGGLSSPQEAQVHEEVVLPLATAPRVSSRVLLDVDGSSKTDDSVSSQARAPEETTSLGSKGEQSRRGSLVPLYDSDEEESRDPPAPLVEADATADTLEVPSVQSAPDSPAASVRSSTDSAPSGRRIRWMDKPQVKLVHETEYTDQVDTDDEAAEQTDGYETESLSSSDGESGNGSLLEPVIEENDDDTVVLDNEEKADDDTEVLGDGDDVANMDSFGSESTLDGHDLPPTPSEPVGEPDEDDAESKGSVSDGSVMEHETGATLVVPDHLRVENSVTESHSDLMTQTEAENSVSSSSASVSVVGRSGVDGVRVPMIGEAAMKAARVAAQQEEKRFLSPRTTKGGSNIETSNSPRVVSRSGHAVSDAALSHSTAAEVARAATTVREEAAAANAKSSDLIAAAAEWQTRGGPDEMQEEKLRMHAGAERAVASPRKSPRSPRQYANLASARGSLDDSVPAEALDYVLAEQEELARRERHRRKTKGEIVKSEIKYAQMLSTLLSVFVRPLLSTDTQKSLSISAADVTSALANVEAIANFHQVLLIDLLSNHSLGEIFVNNMGLMVIMYQQYWDKYPAALTALQNLHKSARFREWEAEKRKHPDVNGLDLASFLVLPVQRIPRYELLMNKLLSYTDEELPEAAVLKEAVRLLKRAAENTNSKVLAAVAPAADALSSSS